MVFFERQKGQATVEFALIFPFFIFLVIGFAYTAMLCHDYLTLTAITRDSARSLSVGVAADTIRTRYAGQTFFTEIYTWDSTAAHLSLLDDTPSAGLVRATLTANCTLQPIQIMNLELSLPPTIQASLTMRKEE